MSRGVSQWNTFTSTAHLMIYYFLPVQYGLEANGIAGWIPLATAQPILSAFIAVTQYAIPLYGKIVQHMLTINRGCSVVTIGRHPGKAVTIIQFMFYRDRPQTAIRTSQQDSRLSL